MQFLWSRVGIPEDSRSAVRSVISVWSSAKAGQRNKMIKTFIYISWQFHVSVACMYTELFITVCQINNFPWTRNYIIFPQFKQTLHQIITAHYKFNQSKFQNSTYLIQYTSYKLQFKSIIMNNYCTSALKFITSMLTGVHRLHVFKRYDLHCLIKGSNM